MPNAQVTYLLDRLHLLKAAVPGAGQAPDRWREDDADNLTIEIAEYLREALDIPALERELVATSQLDRGSLVEVKGWFEEIAHNDPTAFAMTFPDGTNFEWQRPIERLNALIESLGTPHGLEEIEIGLRLSMIGDPALERLLMAVRPGHEVRGRLEARLAPKLALLPDLEAMRYWAGLRAEVDPSRDVRIQPHTDVVPTEFFDVGDATDVRKRIARYLATVRPLLLRKAIESGTVQWPAGRALAATVLTWVRESASTRQWSTTDRVVIQSLGRLSACLTGERATALAAALGVPEGGYFAGGRATQDARRSYDVLGQRHPPSHRIFDELPKLLQIADLRSRPKEAPLERTLRAYKLSLEVMAQDVGREMSGKREERVQRELCRFLVERGVLAYGTKFGWSETDIRGHDEIGAAIIETKLVKRIPSTGDINRWLTQLGSYMDQEQGPKAIRGVIVLFNFTPASMIAPESPLRAKYSIVAINLCPDSPSKRRASVEIVPAAAPGIVEVLRIGEAEPKRAGRSRRKARSTR